MTKDEGPNDEGPKDEGRRTKDQTTKDRRTKANDEGRTMNDEGHSGNAAVSE